MSVPANSGEGAKGLRRQPIPQCVCVWGGVLLLLHPSLPSPPHLAIPPSPKEHWTLDILLQIRLSHPGFVLLDHGELCTLSTCLFLFS